MDSNSDSNKKEILERLLDYVKYLYEEEKERKNDLNAAARIYIAFFTIITSIGLFKSKILENLLSLPELMNIDQGFLLTGIVLFILSICFFFISLVYTIFVLKVWKFERPSDPHTTALKSLFISHETELIDEIIADYVVACKRNYAVNETKAKLLSCGFIYLLCGLILFGISFIILNANTIINGG